MELYQRGKFENEVVLFFNADDCNLVLRIGRNDVANSKGLGKNFVYVCGFMRFVFTAIESNMEESKFSNWAKAVVPQLRHFRGNLGKEIARLLLLMPEIPLEYQDQHAPMDDEDEETGEKPEKKPRRD